jgi:hypothetical protein
MRGTVEWSVLSMNSQRLREQRIEERLQGGALALATPSDRVQATPTSDKVCHGCLEPNADARVGDQPWHLLCGLYWQGRSEVVRSERIPYTPAGPGITPARSRWVIVVPVGRADRYAALRRHFGRSPWVDVVMDRRRGERSPHDVSGAVVERRTASRRKPVSNAPTPAPRFRLAHQLEGCDVYEATSPESGRCPDCGVVVSLELPRFAEPPVRLELVLRHEPTAHGVRHVGECQSLSATGRVLLSMRLVGRVGSEPP